jgi:HK97 gp10 family phage protein
MPLKLQGNTALIQKFKKLSNESKEIVQEELNVTIDDIYNQSQTKAPADMGGGGGIRSSAYKDVGQLTGVVGYRNRYAAYQEFGTGTKVKIPKGLEDYSMTFYVNGKGRLPANPFLFPAFFEQTKKFVERIGKELVK